MRSPAEMSTIQIELCSACVKRCSNCTRMSGTKQHEFFISREDFRAAVDSLVEYSKLPHAIVGLMGGEPLLHKDFLEFCDYALLKIGREKLGLWSTFPDTPKYRSYAPKICETFSCILLNDHSRDDILHAPVLMASEEYFRKPCDVCHGKGYLRMGDGSNAIVDYLKNKENGVEAQYPCEACGGKGTITDDRALFSAVNHCWVQESWSASINPKGAWFCEVAAALSDLFDGPQGWKVEPGWWLRTPMEFREQMDWACRKCGAALPIERTRNSQDVRDDVSEGNLERLKAIKSKKVARGEFELRKEFKFDRKLMEHGTYPLQTYKDQEYRQGIAARYGIMLVMNSRGYWDPQIAPPGYKPEQRPAPLFQILGNGYTGTEAR